MNRSRHSKDVKIPSSVFRPPPSAFTLVELLVVVAIIGILMALLMPAVLAARERARIAQCTNNQHELGLAIIQYDLAKRHFPGYVNLVGGNEVSWVPVLFPYLGRRDLWEGSDGSNGWRSGDPPEALRSVRLNQLVCPDDAEADPTVLCPLTYVVNLGLYITEPAPGEMGAMITPGIFLDYSTDVTNRVSLSDVRSPSRTVMLSEKIDPLRDWADSISPLVLGFTWPDPTTPGLDNTLVREPFLSPLSASTIHPGIVIMTFCDGHVASVADDARCSLYVGAP